MDLAGAPGRRDGAIRPQAPDGNEIADVGEAAKRDLREVHAPGHVSERVHGRVHVDAEIYEDEVVVMVDGVRARRRPAYAEVGPRYLQVDRLGCRSPEG